jgi:LysR family transcriptional regulator, nitrogen assimilation regulatory protein
VSPVRRLAGLGRRSNPNLAAMKAELEHGAVVAGASPPGVSFAAPGGRAVELRELRSFRSVARTGNFNRAARELNTSQPNVSYHVQKLEQELGIQLLIRHRRGVTLTQAGSCLVERLDVILGLLNAPLEPAPTPERAAGTISVALPPEPAPLLVPQLLKACRQRWPHLNLVIREGTSASLEEWVLDHRVDVAVLQDPAALDELAIEPVVTERLGLVSGAQRIRLEGGCSVRVRQLDGLKLILPHPRHWIRRLVDNAAFRRGVVFDQVQQVDGVALTKEMVRDGAGHTILPFVAVRDEVARGALSFLPIDHDPLLTNHAIAFRNGMAPAPFVAGVSRLLRDVMSTQARSGAWTGASVIGIPAKTAGFSSHPELEPAIE